MQHFEPGFQSPGSKRSITQQKVSTEPSSSTLFLQGKGQQHRLVPAGRNFTTELAGTCSGQGNTSLYLPGTGKSSDKLSKCCRNSNVLFKKHIKKAHLAFEKHS